MIARNRFAVAEAAIVEGDDYTVRSVGVAIAPSLILPLTSKLMQYELWRVTQCMRFSLMSSWLCDSIAVMLHNCQKTARRNKFNKFIE
jgi:hypothetical protein